MGWRRIDQFWLARHQFGREPGQPLVLVVGIHTVVGDVLPFDPAQLAHLIEEGLEGDLLLRTRARRQHADAARVGDRRLRQQKGRGSRQAGTQCEQEKSTLSHCITSLEPSLRSNPICTR